MDYSENQWIAGAVIGAVSGIAAAVWVYRDSRNYDGTNGVLWALGAFISPIIFIPLYWFFRKKNPAPPPAPQELELEKTQLIEETVPPRARNFSLIGIGGTMNNRQFPIQQEILCIGTDAKNCAIIYPKQVKGISRLHCQIVSQADGLILIDFSSFGTWLNGVKLKQGKPVPLNQDDVFYLASQENSFRVQEML